MPEDPAMDLSRPYTVVSPGIEGKILVTLAGTTRPLTGRDVARLAHSGSREAVRLGLMRLVEQGIVNQERAGRAQLFTLNREHLAAPIVERMAGLRAELLSYLKRTVADWSLKPIHASLFGSAARGDGDVTSDLDVLVVRSRKIEEDDLRWRQQVDDWSRRVERVTGNRISMSEVSEKEVVSLRRRRPAVVAELERDAVTLFGKNVRLQLRGAR